MPKGYRSRHVEIDKITIPSHDGGYETVPLMLDRNSKDYFAEYGGARYQSKVADEVQKLVRAAMTAAHDVEWHDVIEVTLEGERSSFSGNPNVVGLRRERYHWAKFPDGKLRKVYWEATGPQRLASASTWNPTYSAEEFSVPKVVVHYGKTYYLPYTEAIWNGLILLEEKIKELRARLDVLLSTPEGHQTLASTVFATFPLVQSVTTER